MNHNVDSQSLCMDRQGDRLLSVFHKYIRAGDDDSLRYDVSNPPQIDSNTLNRLMQKIDSISPLPEIWEQVQTVLNDPESCPSDLGRIVKQDPILSAHLLRICNSSAYKASGIKSMANVTMAIARLGMGATASFLMEKVVLSAGGHSGVSKQEVRKIWYHSLAISLICRILADCSRVICSSEAGLLGLLHDIGKMVILNVESEGSLAKLRTAIEDDVPSLDAESEVLGYTHIDAGRLLALRWKLPTDVHYIITRHHHPCVYVPDQWPEDHVSEMMIVHTAHIILQSLDHTEESMDIWSTSQRTHCEEVIGLLHTPLQLIQGHRCVFIQIERDLNQLKQMFPDLFSNEDQSLQLAHG